MRGWRTILVCLCMLLMLQLEGGISYAEQEQPAPVASAFYGGRRYALYDVGMVWSEANSYCRSLGGHLVTITSAGEQRIVERMMQSGNRNNYWLGALKASDNWKWVTGESFRYTNWSARQPDNHTGQENVLNIYRIANPKTVSAAGEWNDLNSDGTCNGEVFFGTSNFGFICEWETIGADQYFIQVMNENGDPLEGASVTFDGETAQTGADGTVLFDAFTFGNPVIEVSLDGYMKWTNQDSNWEKSSTRLETIILYPESGSTLKLKSARYSNSETMSLATNLLTTTKKLSLGNDAFLVGDLDFGNFYLSCKAQDTSIVAKYQVWQGSRMIAESTDGFFSLNTDSFSKGNNCFVRIFGTDNTWVDTRINLTFVKADIVEESNINLSGKSISFNVGDDVPFLGGSKFDVSLPVQVPATFFVSDNKIQVGFNVNLAGGESKEEQIKEVKKLCSEMKRLNGLKLGKLTGPQSRKYKALIKNTNKWEFFKNGEINVLGYAEADIGSNTATGAIMLQGKIDAAEFDFNTWCVVVPVTVQVGLELEGNVMGEISYNFSSSTLNGNLTFAPSATLTAFGGVGVSTLAGVGAYGSAKLESSLEILPDPSVKSVDLTGELGLKAYLAVFTYERPFAYNTWHLYTGNTSRSAVLADGELTEEEADTLFYQQLRSGMFDASKYKKADLSYLEDEVDLMGGANSESTDLVARSTDLRSEFTTLIQNTYRNAQPVMVSSGDVLYAAFLRADSSTGRISTVVSKYDGVEWTTAVAASSENLLDSTPNLLVDNSGNIWLAYAQTGSGYDGATLLSYAQNQSIVVGKVDPDTLAFTQSNVYSGAGYAHMQQLSLVNGKPTLVWVDSTVTDDNSVLWSDQNTIYHAVCDDSGWNDPQLVHAVDNTVFELAVGETDGELSIAYIMDEDNSYETTADQNLYTITGGAIELLSSDCSGSITFATLPGTESAAFIWNSGSELHTSNGETLTLEGISGEYIIAGDSIYFSAATDSGAELNVAKYENNAWSVPITLTEGEGYFENLCVVTMNGEDYALGLYTDVTIEESSITDSKNLVWTKVTSVSDVCIDDVSYAPEGIAAGDAIPVTLTASNHGDHAVSSIDIYLDGELLRTESVELPVGASADIAVEITCPSELTAFTFSICETGCVDYHPDDNAAEFSIGYSDVKVTLESQQIGSRCTVYACVTNEGVAAASGMLYFIDSNGEILDEEAFTDVTPGSAVIASYDIDWNATEESRMDIEVILECSADDLFDYNNSGVIHLTYAGYRKDSTPDIMLPAALKRVEDEAFRGGKFFSVMLPEGVEAIGSKAFADCMYLEQMEIPASVTSIAADAFENTDGFVIYGASGSYAETYATENSITFIAE